MKDETEEGGDERGDVSFILHPSSFILYLAFAIAGSGMLRRIGPDARTTCAAAP